MILALEQHITEKYSFFLNDGGKNGLVSDFWVFQFT